MTKDGKMNDKGLPDIWQLALTSKAYLDTVHLASPPLRLQRMIFGALSPIA